mmetsp:Transcript_14792/g.17112  ORF Transcript_14792/g.17112 Transcript_14792/m.17112 type:complete len:131 (-) Transcript_14792:435-827(-)|eukprot:CAMPEP_0168330770 /NCGR_PEP_ID=MMETSP0213-20121227/7936_1 /TAXON_ID=151035 /ORGANISM="Euplotes harpa, Strain FSP1.4" /LENGTH=130 /DNA_ID=CAMNT_0008334419 /DNA_START=295 /DNA_END=687 /DNA_ORIENTATION=+
MKFDDKKPSGRWKDIGRMILDPMKAEEFRQTLMKVREVYGEDEKRKKQMDEIVLRERMEFMHREKNKFDEMRRVKIERMKMSMQIRSPIFDFRENNSLNKTIVENNQDNNDNCEDSHENYDSESSKSSRK